MAHDIIRGLVHCGVKRVLARKLGTIRKGKS